MIKKHKIVVIHHNNEDTLVGLCTYNGIENYYCRSTIFHSKAEPKGLVVISDDKPKEKQWVLMEDEIEPMLKWIKSIEGNMAIIEHEKPLDDDSIDEPIYCRLDKLKHVVAIHPKFNDVPEIALDFIEKWCANPVNEINVLYMHDLEKQQWIAELMNNAIVANIPTRTVSHLELNDPIEVNLNVRSHSDMMIDIMNDDNETEAAAKEYQHANDDEYGIYDAFIDGAKWYRDKKAISIDIAKPIDPIDLDQLFRTLKIFHCSFHTINNNDIETYHYRCLSDTEFQFGKAGVFLTNYDISKEL